MVSFVLNVKHRLSLSSSLFKVSCISTVIEAELCDILLTTPFIQPYMRCIFYNKIFSQAQYMLAYCPENCMHFIPGPLHCHGNDS